MFRRVAAVAALSVLASGLVAASASAATAATITPAQAKAALTASLKATRVAASAGSTTSGQITFANGSGRFTAAVDEARRSSTRVINGYPAFAAVGAGYWLNLVPADRVALKPELALLGRPGARFVLVPNGRLPIAEVRAFAYSPLSDLEGSIADDIVSATRTDTATGTSYQISARNVGGTAYSYTETFDVASDGRLLASRGTQSAGAIRSYTMAFGYGAQKVVTPSAPLFVTEPQLTAAQYAVAHYNALVRQRADQVAATAKALAKAAHRSRVSQADVRRAAAKVAAAHRTDLVRVSTANVAGGVRLTAVNPATHKRIAFTVKAVGGRAVVRAA